MKNLIWRFLAKLLAWAPIASFLIRIAQRTPYQHILSADGTQVYMGRWWLLNPYDQETYTARHKWFPWSIRVHHIMRPDEDRDLHDHPWDARTVILRGHYIEQRIIEADPEEMAQALSIPASLLERAGYVQATEFITRRAGDSATLSHNNYHRIDKISGGGVWTLFITGPKQGSWGFLVSGKKVPWREYNAQKASQPITTQPSPALG